MRVLHDRPLYKIIRIIRSRDALSPNKNYLRPINITYIVGKRNASIHINIRRSCVIYDVVLRSQRYVKNQLSDAAAAASVGNGFAGGRTWEIGARLRGYMYADAWASGKRNWRCLMLRFLIFFTTTLIDE